VPLHEVEATCDLVFHVTYSAVLVMTNETSNCPPRQGKIFMGYMECTGLRMQASLQCVVSGSITNPIRTSVCLDMGEETESKRKVGILN
jgi:hypothetical protein